MDIAKRKGRLSITTSNGNSKMEVHGNGQDILFNWLVMTSQVCKVLKIPVEEMIRDLPAAIRDYETHGIRECIEIRRPGSAGTYFDK